MSNEKRGLGDNSINTSDYIGGVEYLHSALDEAVKLIVRLSKRNAKTDKLLNNSIYAKNNLQRGVHLNKAIEVQSKNKSELESFDGCEKSNLNISSDIIEPLCSTCPPSICLSA